MLAGADSPRGSSASLAAAMFRAEGYKKAHPVVEAVGMWAFLRDFQRVWEAWEAGF